MSGGGSSSGKSDYPTYMKEWHAELLGNPAPLSGVASSIAAAAQLSPYHNEVAYNPDLAISAFETDVASLRALVTALSPSTNWLTYRALPNIIGFSPSVHTPVAVGTFDTPATVAALSTTPTITDISALMPLTNISDIDAEIAALVAANDAEIDDKVLSDILPRFMAGMRDINAVHSSAFTIGRAIIEAFALRDKNKVGADLRLMGAKEKNALRLQYNQQLIEKARALVMRDQASAEVTLSGDRNNLARGDLVLRREDFMLRQKEVNIKAKYENARLEMVFNELMLKREELISGNVRDIMQLVLSQLEYSKTVAHYGIESNRIKTLIKREEQESQLEYASKDALWYLELYTYGANMLAAISGAATTTKGGGPSKAQSAIGGGLSGAAAGAMMGSVVPGVGTVVGAVAGGLLGMGSAFL